MQSCSAKKDAVSKNKARSTYEKKLSKAVKKQKLTEGQKYQILDKIEKVASG